MKKALCHSLIADRRSRVPRRPPLLVCADIKSVKRTSRSQHQDLRWVINSASLFPNLAKSLGIPELLLFQPILRFWPNIDRFRCPKPDRSEFRPRQTKSFSPNCDLRRELLSDEAAVTTWQQKENFSIRRLPAWDLPDMMSASVGDHGK